MHEQSTGNVGYDVSYGSIRERTVASPPDPPIGLPPRIFVRRVLHYSRRERKSWLSQDDEGK